MNSDKHKTKPKAYKEYLDSIQRKFGDYGKTDNNRGLSLFMVKVNEVRKRHLELQDSEKVVRDHYLWNLSSDNNYFDFEKIAEVEDEGVTFNIKVSKNSLKHILLSKISFKKTEIEEIFSDYELQTIYEKMRFLEWAKEIKKRIIDDDDPATYELCIWEMEYEDSPPFDKPSQWILWALENDVKTTFSAV